MYSLSFFSEMEMPMVRSMDGDWGDVVVGRAGISGEDWPSEVVVGVSVASGS